jgi:hypothetical protein
VQTSLPLYAAAVAEDDGALDALAVKVDAEDKALKFNEKAAFVKTIDYTIDGVPMQLDQYQVTYVAKPVQMAAQQPNYGPTGYTGDVALDDVYSYQKMNIYVPKGAKATAPIWFGVNNGGWRTSAVGDIFAGMMGGAANYDLTSTSNSDYIGRALKQGWVVVNCGMRSRGALAADGTWGGKAPAVVVDAKAAIRYLRLNDALIPGSAERIIITGGSGGGGLSTAVAASGNSPDYYPYLNEIGAAGMVNKTTSTIKDDVFAVVAYCAITDLGNADIAYEWMYSDTRKTVGAPLSAAMTAASDELKAQYPGYIDSLGLYYDKDKKVKLSVDNLDDALIEQIQKEITKIQTKGKYSASDPDIPALGDTMSFAGMGGGPATVVTNDWLDASVSPAKVDYSKFLAFVATISALKDVPAFSSTGVTGVTVLSGEDSLYGSKTAEYSNFTQWSWDHNEIAGDGIGKDDTGKATAAKDVTELRTPLAKVYLKKKATYTPVIVADLGNGKTTTVAKAGVTYTTSDAKIAKVDDAGVITAAKAGKATITATAPNGKYVKITVNVVTADKPLSSVAFTKKSVSVKKGKTKQLEIKLTPAKATDVGKITYSSSDKKVATVDKAGKVTGVKKGKAVITVKTAGKKKATIKVTVK